MIIGSDTLSVSSIYGKAQKREQDMLTVQRKAKIIGFNYDSLAPADAKVAKIAAKRIRGKMTGNVISIGEDLLSVKGKLSHGHFGAWLRAEFGMAQRTAQRYMAAARLADDCDEVAHLSPSALHALSAPTTPKSARAKIIGRLQAGETLEAREVTAVIRTEIATKQPTTRAPNKPAKSGTNATVDPKVAFGERTRELVRKRLPPANKEYFWLRIHVKGGRLFACKIRNDKGNSHDK